VSEKVHSLTEIRGMAGAVPDRRRQSLGQGGAARCATGVDSGSADGGCGGSTGGAAVARGEEEDLMLVY
jgi:hypothetical protein